MRTSATCVLCTYLLRIACNVCPWANLLDVCVCVRLRSFYTTHPSLSFLSNLMQCGLYLPSNSTTVVCRFHYVQTCEGRRVHTRHSKKFLLAISQNELSRQSASRIAQFRLSHAPVNHFLKQIGKVDSARCPACGADNETIEHFLLACPNYAHERWTLTRQARKLRKQLTMETLLGDHNMVASLASYIDATQRFRSDGEHTFRLSQQSTR